MSAPPEGKGEPIADKRAAGRVSRGGCKPRADWRIGTEHEKFAYRTADLRPLPYEGPDGIRALLEGLAREFGWQPVLEGGRPIALVKDGGSVTLEPGGQFELCGAPLETLHQTCCEVHAHLDQVRKVAGPLGVACWAWASTLNGRARHPLDAQGALQDHVRVHAEARLARPRHDAADLHDPGQSRLRGRGRHGPQVPGQPGAAADRDRAVRQLALHRGPAQRLPLLSQPHLDRHRPGPLRHASPSCSSRAWASSATSITCSTCRCTSSTATAAISTRAARASATSCRAGCRRCRASCRR